MPKFVVLKNETDKEVKTMVNGIDFVFKPSEEKVLDEGIAKLIVQKTSILVNYDQIKEASLKILNKSEISNDAVKSALCSADNVCVVKNCSDKTVVMRWDGFEYIFAPGGIKALNKEVGRMLRENSLSEGKYTIDYVNEEDFEIKDEPITEEEMIKEAQEQVGETAEEVKEEEVLAPMPEEVKEAPKKRGRKKSVKESV